MQIGRYGRFQTQNSKEYLTLEVAIKANLHVKQKNTKMVAILE